MTRSGPTPASARPLPKHEVTDVEIEEVGGTRWLPILRVHYTEDGVRKRWDMLRSADAVAVLLDDVQRKEVVLVKQLRVPVFVDGKDWLGKRGVLLETCAGLIDKSGKDALATACAEVWEETGYHVRPADLVALGPVRGAAAVAGQRIHMYYAQVSDHLCKGVGGGVEEEGENIGVVRLSYADVLTTLEGELRVETTPLTAYMLLWFATHKLGFPRHRARLATTAAVAAFLGAAVGAAAALAVPRFFARSSL